MSQLPDHPADSRQSPPNHQRFISRKRLKRFLRVVLALFLVLLIVGWWNVLRIDMGDHWPPPEGAVTAAQAQETVERFTRQDDPRRDDIAIDYAPSTASDVQLFNGGEEFFPAMLEDIARAESSIHIAMFVFVPGEWADRFADELIRQSEAGVEVRLTVDRHGSKVTSTGEGFYEMLSEAGIEVAVNDVYPLQATGLLRDRDPTWSQDEVGHADHRKLLVIDGLIGWVGGAGFEDHFDNGRYHDVFARVEGAVVRQLQTVFLTGFVALGGPLPEGGGALAAYFPTPRQAGDIGTTVLQNVPGGFRPGTEATLELLDVATGRIDILNPYLTDPDIIARLIEAAERGVQVRVVIPGESNNPPADAALEHRYPDLLDAGVEIMEYPVIMHAKVLVADDAVVVGSLNYDAWALYRNVELSLLIEDPGAAEKTRTAFIEPALAVSEPAQVAEGTGEKVRNWFWDKLTYFL